jgi:hypothetical protein
MGARRPVRAAVGVEAAVAGSRSAGDKLAVVAGCGAFLLRAVSFRASATRSWRPLSRLANHRPRASVHSKPTSFEQSGPPTLLDSRTCRSSRAAMPSGSARSRAGSTADRERRLAGALRGLRRSPQGACCDSELNPPVKGRAITLPRWQGWAKAARRKLDKAMEQDAELRQAA